MELNKKWKEFITGREKKESARPNSGERRSPFEREITIKLNPGKIFRFALVVVLLLSVFYLGRLSAGSDLGIVSALFADDEVEEEEVVPEEGEAVEEEFPELEEAEAVEEEPEEESESDLTGAATSEPEEPEEEEPIITKYTKVALAFEGVKTEWFDYWGKITALDFTLKNNEAGTIKPSYFIMYVEGYDDMEKKVTFTFDLKTIKAGETISPSLRVPKGFAYNPKTVGVLDDVQIRLILFDENDKPMASALKNVNLEDLEG